MTEKSLEDILAEPIAPVGTHGEVPETLKDLFAKDPFALTDDDLEKICVVFRSQREAFLKEESSAKTEGRRPAYAKGQKAAGKTPVDISKIEF